LARLILAIAIGLDGFAALLLLNAPHTMGGDPSPPSGLGLLILLAGLAANVIGLAWMMRIYRSDPEAHPSFWRSNRSG
jgi:hypothetical protein